MMPGIGFEEMVIFALLAIVVIGPKDLPLMMRKFGRFTGKMRAMAFEFKQGIDELGRQAELDELRKEVANLKAHTGLDDIKKEIEQESADMRSDVNSAMTHPAIAAPAATVPPVEAVKPVAPYAGLSADHPGYDAGGDFRIDGAPPAPATNGHHVNGEHVTNEHVNGAPEVAPPEPLQASEPHIIPDDEVQVRHPAIKQDTPA